MPDLPTHDDLYSEFRDAVVGDAESALNDFSAGSLLDLFAGLAAISGRQAMRWVARQMRRAFIQTAEGDELDFAIADRVGERMPRFADEADDTYRARYYAFLETLGPGSDPSWRYFIERETPGHDSDDYTIDEDDESGVVTLRLTALEGEIPSEVADALRSTFPRARVLGIPTNVKVSENA